MKALSFLPLILFTACASIGNTPKSEKHQMEMTLHKTRSDLEEAKHDLHTLKMELAILEGKMVNQEDQMAGIKKETFDLHQTKLENCATQIGQLDRKLSHVELKQEEIFIQLQKIAGITSEMSKALAQGKEKVNELERNIASQSKSGPELVRKLSRESQKNEEIPNLAP